MTDPEVNPEIHMCETKPEDEGGDMKFGGHYGAPGIGTAWECKTCGKAWSKVGGTFYTAESMVHCPEPDYFI